MAKALSGRKRIRKDFGRIPVVAPMPNLIEVQKSSYDKFLQANSPLDVRQKSGLWDVFKSVFPIKDFSGKGELENRLSGQPLDNLVFGDIAHGTLLLSSSGGDGAAHLRDVSPRSKRLMFYSPTRVGKIWVKGW